MRNDKNIKMFVRETLGCGCPEEVLRHIDCRDHIMVNNEILLRNKINIGNRLLIYVVEADDSNFVKESLSTLVHTGKDERDSMGFNRFRLVIVADKVNMIREVADRIFKDMDDRDEKVHLHIITNNEIPEFHC